MIVTLDDVACLLHISIIGKLMKYSEQSTYEYNFESVTTSLGVTKEEAIADTCSQWGGIDGIPWLRKLYEKHLSRTNELEGPTNYEEEAERDNTHYCCLRDLCCTWSNAPFTRTNKHTKVVCLEGMHILSRVHEWS
jgi:hypothetical protein